VSEHREKPAFADRLSALFDAARRHHRETVPLYEMACIHGDCECEDECTTRPYEVCAECYRIAEEINDEYCPDAVMAGECAVLVAVETLEPDR
jgi:hypothetical protein